MADFDEAYRFLAPDPDADYGSILPFARNRTTGERRFAMPDAIRSGLLGLTDLAQSTQTGVLTDRGLETLLTSGVLGGGLLAPRGALAAGAARPYENVPDTLMGFRRSGANKGFAESNYPHEQWVHVTFPNGETHVDAIRGMNQSHAIERAHRNWPEAEIKPLTREDAIKLDPQLSDGP